MFALAMNAARHRSQFALLSFVSPRAAVLLTPGTDFRRRRNSGRPYDRPTVVSSTYKLLTLSRKRSPSNSTDYKLPGEGAILLLESKCTALSGLSHPESTLASILPQPMQLQHLRKITRGGYPALALSVTPMGMGPHQTTICAVCASRMALRDLAISSPAVPLAPKHQSPACPPKPRRRRVTSLPSEASAKEGHQPALRRLGEGGSPACPPKPRRRRVTSLPSEAPGAQEGYRLSRLLIRSRGRNVFYSDSQRTRLHHPGFSNAHRSANQPAPVPQQAAPGRDRRNPV